MEGIHDAILDLKYEISVMLQLRIQECDEKANIKTKFNKKTGAKSACLKDTTRLFNG